VVIAILLVILGGIYYLYSGLENKAIKIFSAGSLSEPLNEFSLLYEDTYGVKVNIEYSGSVDAIRKIIDAGKYADIIAVADYSLLDKMLYPKYINWYIGFAVNEMVIAYTNSSKYSDIIRENPGEWIKILLKDDVKYGFSDPNKDPCGYRAIGVIALTSIISGNFSILNHLLISRTNIDYQTIGDEVILRVPYNFKVYTGNILVRPKSIELISLLESGSIDYAFEYKSVVVQHNLNYIELPSEINLGDPSKEDVYSNVKIILMSGSESEGEITLGSIIYGISILKLSSNYDEAIEYVKLLLSNTGKEVFQRHGHKILDKPLYFGEVPNELRL